MIEIMNIKTSVNPHVTRSQIQNNLVFFPRLKKSESIIYQKRKIEHYELRSLLVFRAARRLRIRSSRYSTTEQ